MTGDYEDRRNLDMDTEVLPLVKPSKERKIVCYLTNDQKQRSK